MANWSHRILGQVGNILHLTCPLNGRTAYYFLLCSKEQRTKLLESIGLQKEIEITDYGTLICSGWDEISEDDRALLREKHQVNC